MSKTDKTRPYWVQVAVEKHREVHYHQNGVCDLPDSPIDQKHYYWNHCHYELVHEGNLCGCRMCTAHDWRRVDRRRSRHRAKALLRGGYWEMLSDKPNERRSF